MTGIELKNARYELNLTLSEMAEKLGYAGKNAKDHVRKMESGKKPITDDRAAMIYELLKT